MGIFPCMCLKDCMLLQIGNSAWWRHQMETFSALLTICAWNSPVTAEFTAQRPVARSFDVFFDLRLNKWLSKQSWGWWLETPSRSLLRQCNGMLKQIRFSSVYRHIVAFNSSEVFNLNNCFRFMWGIGCHANQGLFTNIVNLRLKHGKVIASRCCLWDVIFTHALTSTAIELDLRRNYNMDE